MPIDSSIYSNVQAPKIDLPSPVDSAEKAMKLSQLGMQQAQMGYQMMTQGAVRSAYAQNTDMKTGELNRSGFLSDLSKAVPQAAQEYQQHFAMQDKQQAEAQVAQMQAAHQTLSLTTPALQYLLGLPDDQAAKAFPNVMQQLKSQGVPMQNTPPSWDRGWAQQGYQMGSQTKEGLEMKMAQFNLAKIPGEINAQLYGSRSPNAELTSQYNTQVKPIQGSQMAMQQMIDNYKNPSPQGDASLVLNAFKIKFPNVPDVQSLEELSTAQATPDKWKNIANKVMAGGLDQPTRDNLMRDGISTFRANVTSLKGIQEKFQERQKQQNVNDPSLTSEPAINKTYAEALNIQKDIGPYIPPAQRGGVTGAVTKLASKLMGTGGDQSANASAPKAPPAGMIRMQDPQGNVRLIPEGSKAEAIAAGGRMVK